MRLRKTGPISAAVMMSMVGSVFAAVPEIKKKFDSTQPSPGAGQWWQYRGDRRLSGRSSIKGNIEKPSIRWSHPIAGRETLLEVTLAKGSERVSLPAKDIATSPAGNSWDQILMSCDSAGLNGVSWFDTDGNGQLTSYASNYNQKIGKVLSDQPGLQLIETEPKGYPKVPNVYKGTVRLKTRQNGQWATRWETETQQLIWEAEPIFGDFDGDGKNEIALLPWFRLTILDAATGKLKEQCNYLAEDQSEIPGHGGRSYGWFGATDIDGDGRPEFVMIDDFIHYAAVIGRQDGKLKRLWLKVWEPEWKNGEALGDRTVIVRVNPEPVQDVDGDGHKEIVVSIFNVTGDDRWHILVLDALTGATKFDLPGLFLTGLRDADGDGIPDLFCTAVKRGPRIPEPAGLSILTCKGGKPIRLWDMSASGFVTYEIGRFPATVNSGASMATQTILCGSIDAGRPNIFFTRKTSSSTAEEVEIICWQYTPEKQFRPIATWIGPRLTSIMIRSTTKSAASVLLTATTFDGESAEVKCPGHETDMRVLVSRRVPAPLSNVVIGRPEPHAAPIVVVQGANETVEAFRPTPDGKTNRLWRVPGRGMTCSNYYEGALLADLSGDGRLAVVVGTRGKTDCARLAALSAGDGRVLWFRDFEDFPGAPPPWNVPGLMYWQGGYYRDPKRMDLLVQMRRVDAESYLLDGRTGEIIWKQDKGRPIRGFGRAWMAMYDFDGDGLEDILNLFPDMFCVARGRDGKLLVAEESHKYVDIYAYYADMLVADVLGKGEPQVLYCHEFVTALLTGRGERIWKLDHPHPGGWMNQAGWGDMDGDGHFEFFFPGAMGDKGREFQCRDAATGALKWRLPMPDQPPTFPAVADINGDGHDECVFSVGRTVYAVGTAKAATGNVHTGKVLWTLDLPGRAGPVAIADVEGNAAAQIVVACDDGHVYGIGPTAPHSQP